PRLYAFCVSPFTTREEKRPMKPKVLLRSLLLALLVIVTGCSVSRPATDTAVRKNDSASPPPPVEQPLAKPAPVTPSAVAQDKRVSKTDNLAEPPLPAASVRVERQPMAVPAPPAPPAAAEIAAMAYNAQ